MKPPSMSALHRQGLALLRAGHQHDAHQCLREAVLHEPGEARAHYHLGLTWRLRGELAEARAALKAALDKRTASRLARSLDTVLVPGEADGTGGPRHYRMPSRP